MDLKTDKGHKEGVIIFILNIFLFKYGNKPTAFLLVAYIEISGPYVFIIKFPKWLDVNKFVINEFV